MTRSKAHGGGSTPRSLQIFFAKRSPDLGVPGNRRATVLGRVVPPGMASAFSQEVTAMGAQVFQELAALHTAIVSSENRADLLDFRASWAPIGGLRGWASGPTRS